MTETEFRDLFIQRYYHDRGMDPSTPENQRDMATHLVERPRYYRDCVIPWLNRVLPLRGAKVLEVGCGTGCATQVLAELGADVDAIDIDANAVTLTQARCQLHGVPVRAKLLDAVDMEQEFRYRLFNTIIFSAVLEHMSLKERLSTLGSAWRMLRPGAFLCILDTPNRLWYYDHHSMQLPFLHWLPDDVALAYAQRFSPRGFCKTLDIHKLTRFGRSISYHELELAGIPLDVASALRADDGELQRGLRALEDRGLDPAFFQPSLDILIRKPTGSPRRTP